MATDQLRAANKLPCSKDRGKCLGKSPIGKRKSHSVGHRKIIPIVKQLDENP